MESEEITKTNNENPNRRNQSEFTNTQMKILYSIVDQFGNDRKQELMRELKSMMRYDRVVFKNRVSSALRCIL